MLFRSYCNYCEGLRDSIYGLSLYSTPKYLIINLNRGKGGVYQCNVIFPEDLNIFNYVKYKLGPNYFELFAVIVHFGPSSMGRHFVAYCKNRMDNNWYLYNDAMISKCEDTKEYMKGMPYILFYKKK